MAQRLAAVAQAVERLTPDCAVAAPEPLSPPAVSRPTSATPLPSRPANCWGGGQAPTRVAETFSLVRRQNSATALSWPHCAEFCFGRFQVQTRPASRAASAEEYEPLAVANYGAGLRQWYRLKHRGYRPVGRAPADSLLEDALGPRVETLLGTAGSGSGPPTPCTLPTVHCSVCTPLCQPPKMTTLMAPPNSPRAPPSLAPPAISVSPFGWPWHARQDCV